MPFDATALRKLLPALSPEDSTEALRTRSLPERLARRRDMRLGQSVPDGQREAAVHILGPNVIGRLIFFVAEPGSPLHDHIGWLDRHTRGVHALNTLDEAETAARQSPYPSLTVVSLDMCFSLNAAFDLLTKHRQRAPERVVVVASHMFAQHDMSCQRARIADASLRLPASQAEFALCLSAAVTNNGHVRSRLHLV